MDKRIVSGRENGKQAEIIADEFTDLALLKAGYALLKAANNTLSLENNRLMGVNLKSEIITKSDLKLISNAIEDSCNNWLHHKYGTKYHIHDLFTEYAEILARLDKFLDQSDKDTFRISETN